MRRPASGLAPEQTRLAVRTKAILTGEDKRSTGDDRAWLAPAVYRLMTCRPARTGSSTPSNEIPYGIAVSVVFYAYFTTKIHKPPHPRSLLPISCRLQRQHRQGAYHALNTQKPPFIPCLSLTQSCELTPKSIALLTAFVVLGGSSW
jgi:hypothetical protein